MDANDEVIIKREDFQASNSSSSGGSSALDRAVALRAPKSGDGDSSDGEGSGADQQNAASSPGTGKAVSSAIGSMICQGIKTAYSGALLLFSIVMVTAAIFQKQTTATAEYGLHPVIAYAVFWTLLLWLALMEGGLNIMVGLKPVDQSRYAQSHKLTHACTKVVHKDGNLKRFIVGRQYLDLSSVFLTNFIVSVIDDVSVLGLPAPVTKIFMSTGLAVCVVTIVIGQLVAAINSSKCMLDWVNNYVMVATTYVALTVEGSGILHAVYLVEIIVARLSGKSAGERRKPCRRVLFWARIVFSVTLLLAALTATFKALFDGATTMWDTVPAYASVILLVFLILVCGIMESLQIAFMATLHMDPAVVNAHPVARKNCSYIFKGANLQTFLVGRQIFQTVIMFVIARITTLDSDKASGNVFGVPDVVQRVFNTGVLGALISTIIASLSWRVLASSFPLAFLSSPLSGPVIWLCMMTEATGICSIAWALAAAHRKLFGLKKDTHYLGKGGVTNSSVDNESTQQGSESGPDSPV